MLVLAPRAFLRYNTGAARSTLAHKDLPVPSDPEPPGQLTTAGATGRQAMVLYQQGRACQSGGQIGPAEDYYRAALAADPSCAPAWLGLGEVCKKQGRAEESRVALQRFTALTDDSALIAAAQALLAELDGRPYKRCSRCGSFSTLGRYYLRTAAGQEFCPRCVLQGQQRDLRRSLWVMAAAAAIAALVLLLVGPAESALLWLLGNLPLLILFSYLLIIPHELAHAGMALLLGGHVMEVRLGVGQILWERRWRGRRLSLCRYPLGGFCVLGFPSLQGIRARHTLTVASGPLFTVALGLLLLLQPGLSLDAWMTTLAWREALAAVCALQFAVNIFPRRLYLGPFEGYSDGRQLWRLLSGKESAALIHQRYFLATGISARLARDHEQAREAAAAGLALYPDSTMLQTLRAAVDLDMGRPAEALDIFRAQLARLEAAPGLPDVSVTAETREATRALLMNNVAYAIVMGLPTPELLAEAGRLSEQAYTLLPWQPSIEGTRGAVLVEQGRLALGIIHLQSACAHHDEPTAKASNLAHLALAHHRLGDAAQAAALLAAARALDARNSAVLRVQGQIEGKE